VLEHGVVPGFAHDARRPEVPEHVPYNPRIIIVRSKAGNFPLSNEFAADVRAKSSGDARDFEARNSPQASVIEQVRRDFIIRNPSQILVQEAASIPLGKFLVVISIPIEGILDARVKKVPPDNHRQHRLYIIRIQVGNKRIVTDLLLAGY
jgi:hypothetical protein